MRNYYYHLDGRNLTVVAFVRGDVNGDWIPDRVYITGIKESDVAIIKNLTLVIQDGATGRLTQVPLNENIGYNPTLFLGDFTGDGVRDILITIATGGSGGTTYNYVYTFVHNNLRLLFDSDIYNEMYRYEVTYIDDYRVEVFSSINNTKYLIDLSLREPEYLNEIYDTDGRLKTTVTGWVDPISGLYPIDFDSNKTYELLAYQKISGRYHADSLGFMQNRLKWNGTRFVLDYQDLAIFGSQAD